MKRELERLLTFAFVLATIGCAIDHVIDILTYREHPTFKLRRMHVMQSYWDKIKSKIEDSTETRFAVKQIEEARPELTLCPACLENKCS